MLMVVLMLKLLLVMVLLLIMTGSYTYPINTLIHPLILFVYKSVSVNAKNGFLSRQFPWIIYPLEL